MPSPLFDALFLIAVFVPFVMYLTGVIVLMVSLVLKHFAAAHQRPISMEALAH